MKEVEGRLGDQSKDRKDGGTPEYSQVQAQMEDGWDSWRTGGSLEGPAGEDGGSGRQEVQNYWETGGLGGNRIAQPQAAPIFPTQRAMSCWKRSQKWGKGVR